MDVGPGCRTLSDTPSLGSPFSPPSTDTFQQIDANYNVLCGLHTDGTVECWSSSSCCGFGGDGSEPTTGTFLYVAAGRKHSCALGNDNVIDCWGDNSCGQLDVPVAGGMP